MKTKLLFLIAVYCLISFSAVSAKQMAITFDDLPANRDVSVAELNDITREILTGLNEYHVPVVGFVNEKQLEGTDKAARTAALQSWIDHGETLGNHTYSHVSLNHTPLKAYEAEVLHGEEVTKQLMQHAGLTPHYFRHPYLHTGVTPEIRHQFEAFLKQHGYKVAPVTFDTDDWQFDRLYVAAKQKGNLNEAQEIADKYLAHTQAKFDFYDKATHTMFGRDIAQIWLLHANSINSDHIDELLSLAKNNGYSFVSLDKALQDPVYKSKDVYYKDFGLSWLYRWDYSNGLKVDWKTEPEPDLNSYTA